MTPELEASDVGFTTSWMLNQAAQIISSRPTTFCSVTLALFIHTQYNTTTLRVPGGFFFYLLFSSGQFLASLDSGESTRGRDASQDARVTWIPGPLDWPSVDSPPPRSGCVGDGRTVTSHSNGLDNLDTHPPPWPWLPAHHRQTNRGPPILYLGVHECRALNDDPSNHVLAVTRMALESQSRAQHRELATGAPLGSAKARRVGEAGKKQHAQVTTDTAQHNVEVCVGAVTARMVLRQAAPQCGRQLEACVAALFLHSPEVATRLVGSYAVERHHTNNIDNGKRRRNVAILTKFAMPKTLAYPVPEYVDLQYSVSHYEYELYPESQEETVEDLQGQFGRAGQGRVAHPPPCLSSSISISNSVPTVWNPIAAGGKVGVEATLITSMADLLDKGWKAVPAPVPFEKQKRERVDGCRFDTDIKLDQPGNGVSGTSLTAEIDAFAESTLPVTSPLPASRFVMPLSPSTSLAAPLFSWIVLLPGPVEHRLSTPSKSSVHDKVKRCTPCVGGAADSSRGDRRNCVCYVCASEEDVAASQDISPSPARY
ncbi:hypothetical protein CSOJ01_11729 [Colletotrichum sojae]|uniref:Uncharacterized protein n=1 Tax=Colletotrichum sojae TaxID=2175907 RepID=A0A8H6IXF5_9PEZI|nr:hypothetical protein CSOJ01_11729 [Colletotrichum sojae]